jgi:hypothetical protein
LNPDYPAFGEKLLRDEWFREKARAGEAWFRQLDQSPEGFLKDLSARIHPTSLLGRYFEALLSFWVREYLKPESFRASVPVHERERSKSAHGRRTIGEFDFLFKARSPDALLERPQHWEASVKFYLFCGNNPEQGLEMSSFYGTFMRDRLDLKVHRIFDHQLKLGENPEAHSLLASMGLEDLQPRAWVKGMLFYPSESDWRNHLHPPEVSPHHLRGWWTRAGEMVIPTQSGAPQDSAYRRTLWALLPKYRWLSPCLVQSGDREGISALLTLEQMKSHCQSHFSEHLSPLMWAELCEDPATKAWVEVHRGIVVQSKYGLDTGSISTQ